MPANALLTSPTQVSAARTYALRLADVLARHDWRSVDALTEVMAAAWKEGRQVFVCGNGGSAANAVHVANDFVYPVAKQGTGMRISALTANPAVLTCLANDVAYESIFAKQLEAFARPGDVLIVLSGSGNSENVVRALEVARELGMTTVAVLGFSGGKCLPLADVPVHFEVDDMQIAEDLQLVVGHIVMQALAGRHADGAIRG